MLTQSTFKRVQPLIIWGIADIYFVLIEAFTIALIPLAITLTAGWLCMLWLQDAKMLP